MKTLHPNPDTYSFKMLEPDSMNPDPQYCFAATTSVLTNVVDQHWFQLVTLRIRIQGFDVQKIYSWKNSHFSKSNIVINLALDLNVGRR